MSDGGYIGSGFTTCGAQGEVDLWAIKLDAEGNLLWSMPVGSIYPDFFGDSRPTVDGGLVMVGWSAPPLHTYAIAVRLASTEGIQARSPYGVPSGFQLGPNYPNPFNLTTSFSIVIPASGQIEFKVCDITGRALFRSSKTLLEAGEHSVQLDFGNQPSGVYFCNVRYKNLNLTKKVVLLK